MPEHHSVFVADKSKSGLKSYLYEQGRIPECSNFIFILTGYPLDVNTPVNLLKLTKLY